MSLPSALQIVGLLQFEEKHHSLLVKVIAEQLQCSPSAIVDFELNVCDTQAGVIGGEPLANSNFLSRSNMQDAFCQMGIVYLFAGALLT